MVLFREYNSELQTSANDEIDPSLVPSQGTDEPQSDYSSQWASESARVLRSAWRLGNDAPC
jgi:hypothetical protein